MLRTVNKVSTGYKGLWVCNYLIFSSTA